jgi:hypothetical protein
MHMREGPAPDASPAIQGRAGASPAVLGAVGFGPCGGKRVDKGLATLSMRAAGVRGALKRGPCWGRSRQEAGWLAG